MAGHRRCVRALLAVVATTGGMTVGTALAPATAGAETTSVAIGAVTAHVFANPNDSGDVDLAFFSDDGWILGVGPGPGGATATQVSGASENAPTASPMHGYPVVGAFNTPTAPVGNVTTVHFPAAGSYPVELDYTECCAGELSFPVTANGAPIPPQPPADSSSLAYTGPRTLEFHDPA